MTKIRGYRREVAEAIEEAGFLVEPWNTVRVDAFCVVRPGGIDILGRIRVEVWLINPLASNLRDVDDDLLENASALWRALRHLLIDLVAQPGPPYNPTGKGEHATMVLTGSLPTNIGLGGDRRA